MKAMKKFVGLIIVTLLLVGCSSQSMFSQKRTAENPFGKKLTTEDYRQAALLNVEMGLTYMRQGDIPRAKTKLAEALRLAPEIPEPHSALAHFYEQTHDIKKSEEEHKRALRLGDGRGKYLNNYGGFLCRQKRYREAEDAFMSAIDDELYARTAEVYENAGFCALKERNYMKAENYFIHAIQRDPARYDAVLELADLSMQTQRYSQADRYLQQAKKQQTPSARALLLEIQLARALKQTNRVVSQGMLLKSMYPDSPEYRQYQIESRS